MDVTDTPVVDEELAELLALTGDGGSWGDWLAGATDVESGASTSLPPPMELEEETECDSRLDRRRRQKRESMVRSRTRQRETETQLTAQTAALQHILHQMLVHKKTIYYENGQIHTPIQRSQARFTELVRAREALQQENQQLSRNLLVRDQRLLVLGRLIKSHSLSDPWASLTEISYPSTPRAYANHSVPTGRWLQLLQNESPLFYELLDSNTCAHIISQSLQAIDRIHESLTSPSQVLFTTHCLGWTVERTREIDTVNGKPCLRMRCVKRIPRARISLQELQDKTWEFMSTPELVEQATDGNTSAVVAQQVNDDIVVLLRNSHDKTRKLPVVRCFRMNARMWSTNGDGSALMLMVVLNKEGHPCEPLAGGQRVQWMKHGFSCGRFSHEGDDRIQIEYTGSFECVSEAHAASLLVVNCLSIFKWENFVVPSRLLA